MSKRKDTRVISDYQKEKYSELAGIWAAELMAIFSDVLDTFKDKENVRIIDIGGASGAFAAEVSKRLPGAHIYVLDNVRYDEWDEYAKTHNIKFILNTAYKTAELFEAGYFDIVFINRAMHHMVFDTWRETIGSYSDLLAQVNTVLKKDGYLCISEETVESYVKDKAASFIIYKLTSCRLRPIVSICRRLEGVSAGVGVCFLSDKSWKNIFTGSGFTVTAIKEGIKKGLKPYWRQLLLLKNHYYMNSYILRKNEQLTQ